jgi:hypothetical protein
VCMAAGILDAWLAALHRATRPLPQVAIAAPGCAGTLDGADPAGAAHPLLLATSVPTRHGRALDLRKRGCVGKRNREKER